MSCYWFNKQELFQKAKEKYHNCGGKGKAEEHYLVNKDTINEKANNKYKDLSEEQKQAKLNITKRGMKK